MPVTEDGVLSSATALAARRADPSALMAALRSELAAHYRLVAANQKHGADFLNGWLNARLCVNNMRKRFLR